VYHETDSVGSKSGNGSWNGIVEVVSSGNAEIGTGSFSVTKERSEVVAFTEILRFSR